MSISVSYFLDTRRIRKDETYPINLRISYRGKKTIYKLGEGTKEDFLAFTRGSTKKGAQKIKAEIMESYESAVKIVSTMQVFDKKVFEKLFFIQPDSSLSLEKTVNNMFISIIRRLKEEDRIGSMDVYRTTVNSILAFHQVKSKLYFSDITKDWLVGFEKWLISNGKSVSTVGIYMRTLRAAYNNAIYEGWVDKVSYPFGRRDYKIPASRNVKKALNLNQIRLIRGYQPECLKEEFARDMFIFSYFCNGINIKDVCKLTYGNIGKDIITFNRSKTTNSVKVLEPIKVALLPEVKDIIMKWGNPRLREGYVDQLVFPFLRGDENGIQLRNRTHAVLKKINKYIKIIAEKLDLGVVGLGTYHSRHSYASISKNAGISIQSISESLGHSSLAVTKSYLASMEDEQIHKNARVLL